MTDLNDLFKVIAEGKKDYETNNPKGKIIKEVKDNVKADLSDIFAQLASMKSDLEDELVVLEAKKEQAIINEISSLVAEETLTPELNTVKVPQDAPLLTPQERIQKTANDVARYSKTASFQQPDPDVVSKDIDDIRAKIRFIEQAVGRIAATGPGGGEVNLRWLDDVDRSTISHGLFLRYNDTKKKFEFTDVDAVIADQIQSDWTQTDDTKLDYIKHKPSLVENLVDLNDIDVSTIQDNYFLKYNATKGKFEFVEIKAETAFADTSEPMGHQNLLESAISFDNSTRTFTISPRSASYTIYTKGTKRVITDTRTVTIPNTTGLYYIYFDTAGVLQYKTTFFDWPNDCMTAYVYWNSETQTAPFVADERHGITLDWQTHEYLHRTNGAAFANGFASSNYILMGDGSLNTHLQLDLNGGTFFDEDLQVDIVHSNTPMPNTWEQDLKGPARIPMFYRSNSAWRIDAPTDFPVKMGTTLPMYNLNTAGSWSVVDIDNNKYGCTYILATNNINYPIIGVIGQTAHGNEADAIATDFNELDLTGLPVVELRPLYKLVFDCKTNYANTPKARLTKVMDLRAIKAVQLPLV